MFFGNQYGILVFNGARWQLIKMPNQSIVFSLDVDNRGTVYVGAVGEFGYLAIDKQGKYIYVSLKDKLKREDSVFDNVWETHATSHGV